MSETIINLVTTMRILKVASCSNSPGKATIQLISCRRFNNILV